MDQLTLLDHPSGGELDVIYAMRDAYFAERGEYVQIRPRNRWLCVTDGISIVACLGYFDDGKTRWALDMYTDRSRASKAGVAMLLREIHARTKETGLALCTVTPHQNVIDGAVKRGWHIAGTMLIRHPEE